MSCFEIFNPATVFIFFACVIVSGIFTMNPVITVISLAGALAFRFVMPGRKNNTIHIYTALMTIACMVFNPVFGHNGATAIAVINNHNVTVEAGLYGIFLGFMLSSAVYWFASFSQIMTSEKIIYILGFVSQKAALVLTMALRFIPLYIRKAGQINSTQKALGLYKDETIVSRLKGLARVFSILLTYMIEKTIITSDSMSARGYSGRRRRNFSLYSFGRRDVIFLLLSLVLTACTVYASSKGAFVYNFYPYADRPSTDPVSLAGYIGYGLLCISPSVTEGGSRLKWRYLKSKISHSDIRLPTR
ncbi:MAG: energy-coupling factor transporter transmembrane protein EcfT [Clostridia bacterium]|nr:energy-coupling factor transporter transmembrane protein EcfT [Clostridia bacterium]